MEIEKIVKSFDMTKIKKYLPYLIGGGVLGVIMLFKNRGTTQQVVPQEETFSNLSYPTSGTPETSQNYYPSADRLIDFQDQLTQLDNKFNLYNSEYKATQGQLQTQADNLQTQLYNNNNQNKLYSEMQNLSVPEVVPNVNKKSNDLFQEKESFIKADTQNLGNNGVGYNQAAQTNFENKIKTDINAYVQEVKRVEQVYDNRIKAGLDTTLQTQYAQKIQKDAPVNLGNNGIGYVMETHEAFMSTISKDKNAYSTELKRVDDVIKNRKDQGLDITNQLKYKAEISKVGG